MPRQPDQHRMKLVSRIPVRRGLLRGRGPALCALGLLVVLCACSSGGRARSPFDGPPPPDGGPSDAEDPITIEVQNLSFNDISVWASRPGGQRRRIARITGKTDRTIRISWNVAVPIGFFIEQTAGRSCTTQLVNVEPNARVWLQIPSNVGQQPCQAGRR